MYFHLIKKITFPPPFLPNLVNFKLYSLDYSCFLCTWGAQHNVFWPVKDSKDSCYTNSIIVGFLLLCHYKFSYIESTVLMYYLARRAIIEDFKKHIHHPAIPFSLILRKDQGLSNLKTDNDFRKIHTKHLKGF